MGENNQLLRNGEDQKTDPFTCVSFAGHLHYYNRP